MVDWSMFDSSRGPRHTWLQYTVGSHQPPVWSLFKGANYINFYWKKKLIFKGSVCFCKDDIMTVTGGVSAGSGRCSDQTPHGRQLLRLKLYFYTKYKQLLSVLWLYLGYYDTKRTELKQSDCGGAGAGGCHKLTKYHIFICINDEIFTILQQ